MKKKERVIGCLVILGIIVSVGIFLTSFREADDISNEEVLEMFNEDEIKSDKKQEDSKQKESTQVKEVTEVIEAKEIVVEIKGEVKMPSVYTLVEGSRVHELIEKAGGLSELANVDEINRASPLSDGECIVIANINDKESLDKVDLNVGVSEVNKPSEGKKSEGDIININTATHEDFMTLNGIGEAKAQAIIDYRDTSGGFKSIDDLTSVSGIGEKTLEKIRDKLSI